MKLSKHLLVGYALPIAILILVVTVAGIAFTRVHAEQTAKAQAAVVAPPARPPVTTLEGKLVFDDVDGQSREFIDYFHKITLSEEQEAVLAEALGPMPAACCANSSALTCCCPCNLSKTIWGLSRYLITQHGADSRQVRIAVHDWMSFTNSRGYKGNACYTGGCEGSFASGGCGGMNENKLVL